MESETEHKAKQLSLAGTAASISFVATNTFLVATKVCFSRQNLSRQNYVCRDKTFVTTNICCRRGTNYVCGDKNIFRNKVLSRQTYLYRQMFYRDKHTFIETKHVFRPDKSMLVVFVTKKHVFCRDKRMLVAIKHLSVQNYVCRNKILL